VNETWRWCGHAHHFIGSNRCRYHLATWVGDYLVSTVGDYHPDGETEPMSLGLEPGLFFETMVFPAHLVEDLGRDDNCHGYKVSSWSEVDRWHYQSAEAANEGHLRACFTWGARQGAPS